MQSEPCNAQKADLESCYAKVLHQAYGEAFALGASYATCSANAKQLYRRGSDARNTILPLIAHHFIIRNIDRQSWVIRRPARTTDYMLNGSEEEQLKKQTCVFGEAFLAGHQLCGCIASSESIGLLLFSRHCLTREKDDWDCKNLTILEHAWSRGILVVDGQFWKHCADMRRSTKHLLGRFRKKQHRIPALLAGHQMRTYQV